MGRVYTVGFDDVAVSAVQDLLSINTSSTVPIAIHEIALSQRGLTAWESKPLRFYRVTGSPTITGGTALTARPHNAGDSAAGGTYKSNHTTVFSGGTSVLVRPDEFNFLNGFFYLPAPEDRIILSPSSYFILQLPTAPSASSNMSLSCTFEELC